MEAAHVNIRDARSSDYGFLCEAFRRVNKAHCEMRPDLYRERDPAIPPKWLFSGVVATNFQFGKYCIKIAEQGGKSVGAVFAQGETRSSLSWSRFPTQAYVDNIAVIPGYEGRGIGTALLGAVKQWARQKNHGRIYARIVKENERSLAFFKNAGFSEDHINMGTVLEA